MENNHIYICVCVCVENKQPHAHGQKQFELYIDMYVHTSQGSHIMDQHITDSCIYTEQHMRKQRTGLPMYICHHITEQAHICIWISIQQNKLAHICGSTWAMIEQVSLPY